MCSCRRHVWRYAGEPEAADVVWRRFHGICGGSPRRFIVPADLFCDNGSAAGVVSRRKTLRFLRLCERYNAVLRRRGEVAAPDAKLAAWRDIRDHLSPQPVNEMPVGGRKVRKICGDRPLLHWACDRVCPRRPQRTGCRFRVAACLRQGRKGCSVCGISAGASCGYGEDAVRERRGCRAGMVETSCGNCGNLPPN